MPGETKPPHKKPHGRLANGYFRAYTIFTMSTTHEAAKKWVEEIAQLCQPDSIYWCNGSQEENDELCNMMVEKGTFIKLNPEKRPGCFLARSTLRCSPCGRPHVHLQREGRRRRPDQPLG